MQLVLEGVAWDQRKNTTVKIVKCLSSEEKKLAFH